MKGFLRMSVLLLACFVLVTSGDKKGKSSDEDSVTVDEQPTKEGKRNQGRCGCRGLEDQIDQLEFRLDRMIDLWNDFVDKNRNPYGQQQQGQYPDVRRPPQGGLGGGRGSYYPPDNRLPARPSYGGRSYMEDGRSSQGPGARRFQF